ncbi:MAG: hypothetical protein JO126_02875 [Alphaproteobacteria bacterium]|nr:hypothetical protein [Alphaproteobacteria bacterium]MBV8548384.1 hypothetical protein [Alphaproteobacteria bacterium]
MTLRFAPLILLLALLTGLAYPHNAQAQTNLCTSQPSDGAAYTYNIFSNCHTVTNNTGATICVMTGTSSEWSTFTASSTPWSGVSVGSCCSCTYPWGGTQACGTTGVDTGRYFKQNVYVNACCPNIISCNGVKVTADCSASAVLSCYDGYGDSGCSPTYTSCTLHSSGGCFVSDVSILMSDGSRKFISEIQKGDVVKGETSDNEVLEVKTIETSEDLYGFNGGQAFVTGGHPFRTDQGWKSIDPSLTSKEGHAVDTTPLQIGDRLLTETGSVEVRSIERYPGGPHKVYNPMTDGDHTYFANGLLVHNKCVQC